MIISFERNGVQYLNFDTSNEESVSQLVEQLGESTYQEILNTYVVPATIEEKLRADMDYIAIMTGVEL